MSQQKKIEFTGEQKQQGAEQSSVEPKMPPATSNGAVEKCKTLYLLLEIEQFERFEHWIRMGLIYLEFQNSTSKLNGMAEELEAIPVCTKPVNFDVLVQVKLTPTEYSKIEWCEEKNEFGWLSPGILPINRIKNVQFASLSNLETTSKYLKQGSIVPDVLKAYQTQFEWSVAEVKDGTESEDQVLAIYRNTSRKPLKNNIKKKISDWDKKYGQLSFLKSLLDGYPNINLTIHIIPRIANILGKSWQELKKLEAEIKQEDCWTDRDFYSALAVRDEMNAYYCDHGPESIQTLRNHPETFARKLGEFIEDADFRWGKVNSENQDLTSNFEVIEQLHSSIDGDDYLFTQAILTLSQSASRLNLNSFGETQGNARSRNFTSGGNTVYMTSLPTDSINTLLAECCFSAVKEENFDMKFWLEQLNLREDAIIDLTESQVIVLGMQLDRRQNSLRSTQMFAQLALKLRSDNTALREKLIELENEKSNLNHEMRKRDGIIHDLKRWIEKGVSLLKQ